MNRVHICFFAAIFFLGAAHCAFAQKDAPELSIASIPNQLFIGSNTIVREEDYLFEIVDDQKANISVKEVVTFLNRSGVDHYPIKIYYDQLTKVNKITGQLYDKNGRFIRNLKRFDIDDVSAIAGFSIYEDSRVKIIDLEQNDFPYTLELEYDLSTSDLLHLPHWRPVSTPEVSLEQATFKLRFPGNDSILYEGMNVTQPVEETLADHKRQLTWQIREFKAIQVEPMMVADQLFPAIRTAMERFSYNGIRGNSDGWSNLGKFFFDLNKLESELPEALKTDLERIRESSKNEKETIRNVHKYLKENTRYVSIQVGLGNLQPLSPSFVFENKYGDCKALCDYAKAMLNYFYIPSIYTLINTRRDFQEDLVTDQFDHVVLCVPNRGDTIWIECTDPDLPFDYLGDFSMGRDALLITENGGILTKTPDFYSFQSGRSVKSGCEIFENGRADFNVTVEYDYQEFDHMKHLISASREDRLKEYYLTLGMSDIDIRSITMSQIENYPIINCEMLVASNRFSSFNGDQIIFPAIPFFRQDKPARTFSNRVTPFEIKNSLYYSDSIHYTIPDGYLNYTLPESRMIKSEFGSYSINYQFENEKILVIRSQKTVKGIFEPQKYVEYIDYLNRIVELERQKVILAKN